MLRLLILFILPSIGHAFNVLPEVFYWQELRQEALCADVSNKNQQYWRALTTEKIDSLIRNASINRDYSLVANSLITLSYQEIFYRSKQSEFVSNMSYVYANASHHLGRLVRYNFWPKDSPIGVEDTSLIRGDLLQIAVVIAPKTLAEKLMKYSLELYKELAWSLSAAAICGDQYAYNLVRALPLKSAYRSRSIDEFIYHFVAHEQSFLQEGMYQDPLINFVTKLGILDKMRFITFNGEKRSSFYDWCKDVECGQTSLNLELRIKFDRFAIQKEAERTHWQEELLRQRLQNTKANEIARLFLQTNFTPLDEEFLVPYY